MKTPNPMIGEQPADRTVTRRQRANALRILAMDAVEQAGCGHPGMPMGMADIAEVLFSDYLRFDPAAPDWPDRDRFVVSNGHGCMLQYALLHLTGYALSLDDLTRFRQFGSKTPGHPELGATPGVETTTGPLGQGLANAVGMALAEAMLAAEFNRGEYAVVDHRTWCFVGDGCLMEGLSHEAGALAGHLGLGKLIVFYDDNGISIDGPVGGWFSEDTPQRFESYGWQVLRNINGHAPQEIAYAIDAACADERRPTLICCKTLIGYGAPHAQGLALAHGAALGDDEIAAARRALHWDDDTPFVVPEDVRAAWDHRDAGAALQQRWREGYARYAEAYPESAAELERRWAGELPADWHKHMMRHLHHVQVQGTDVATRKASKAVIEFFAPRLPELFGGSADLSGSNATDWNTHVPVGRGYFSGNYLHYGVREFGMTALASGVALHGGFVPFTATFLTFSDYARNAIRVAALMGIRSIYVYTHDSIGLGEDGPTHQPVEHLASLRVIPNLHVWRPADDVETIGAWMAAIERRDGPTVLALTRQSVPHLERDVPTVERIARGGYVLYEPPHTIDALVIATGSEVATALAAAQKLAADNIGVRVVSMPCLEVFEAQDAGYRQAVLPAAVDARVAIEAGVDLPWRHYVGPGGRVLGVNGFGHSAPAERLYAHFGLTPEAVVAALRATLAAREAA